MAMEAPIFRDRKQAGEKLVLALQQYANAPDTIVLGLPRGGVPIAYEIAQGLQLPLDILLVRKLGLPWHKELAMGAISLGDVIVYNKDVIDMHHVSQEQLDAVIASEGEELNRRNSTYRQNKPFPVLKNKTIILCDDGIATGATFRAAIEALKQHQATRIIAAVPVAPIETVRELQSEVDEIICLETPEPFYGIGMWFEVFEQIADEAVLSYL